MFLSTKYHTAFKSLLAFANSSSSSITISLTDNEIRRLQKKKQFKSLVFASNPYDETLVKTYTIFKNW